MTFTPGRGQSSDEIRADIEQTRERLGHTVESLGAQLNPSNLVQRAKDSVREATIGRVQHMARRTKENVVEGGRDVAGTIRDNPVPAAMIAAGIGWMLMNRRSESSRYESRRYGDPSFDDAYPTEPSVAQRVVSRAASATENLAAEAQDLAQDTAEKVQDVAQQVTHKARTASHRIANKASATTQRVESQFRENPIALGALAIAAGLAVGLSLPASKPEAKLMGGARDQLVDKAKEQLAETSEKVENIVERAAPQVESALRDAAREERRGLA